MDMFGGGGRGGRSGGRRGMNRNFQPGGMGGLPPNMAAMLQGGRGGGLDMSSLQGQRGGDGLGGQLAGLQNMSEEDRQAALAALQDDMGDGGGGGGMPGQSGLGGGDHQLPADIDPQTLEALLRARGGGGGDLGMGGGYGGMQGGGFPGGGLGGLGGLGGGGGLGYYPGGLDGLGGRRGLGGLGGGGGLGGLGGGGGGMPGGGLGGGGLGGLGGGGGGLGGLGGGGGGLGGIGGLGGMLGRGGMTEGADINAMFRRGTGSTPRGPRMPGAGGMSMGPRMPGAGGMSMGPRMPGAGGMSLGPRMQGAGGSKPKLPVAGPIDIQSLLREGGGFGGLAMGGEGGGEIIQAMIQEELSRASDCSDPIEQGMNTIIILDTSDSMQGQPLDDAKEAIERLLSGLEENSMDYSLEENVAFITFSTDATVLQHLTNDYQKIRHALGEVSAGGSSVLYLALLRAIGCLGRANNVDLSGHVLCPRVIVISDGLINEPGKHGPDTKDPRMGAQLQAVQLAKNWFSEKIVMKIFFIPVGSPRGDLPSQLSECTGGQVVLAGDIKTLSRVHLHHRIVGTLQAETADMPYDKESIRAAAQALYSDIQDRDVDEVIKLLESIAMQREGEEGGGDMMAGQRGMFGGMAPGIGGGRSMRGFPQNMGGLNFPGARNLNSRLPDHHSSSLNGPRAPAANITVAPQNTGTGGGTSVTDFLANVQNNKKTVSQGNQTNMGAKNRTNPDLNKVSNAQINRDQDNIPPEEIPKGLVPGSSPIGEDGVPLDLPNDPIPGRDFTEEFTDDLPEEIDKLVHPERYIPGMEEIARKAEAAAKAARVTNEELGLGEPLNVLRVYKEQGEEAVKEAMAKLPSMEEIKQRKDAILRSRGIDPDEDPVADLMEKYRESHPEGSKSLPFQLPGLLGRQEESEEVTQQKINELLERYGGGPPKVDNLPVRPPIGMRVTTGPDWMWRMNGVEIGEKGTIVEDKPPEEGEERQLEDDGWVRVRWDNGVEEDYRYGLDYEFDIQPLEGGMDVVEWPRGRERIIKEPDWLESDEEDFLEAFRESAAKGASGGGSESMKTPQKATPPAASKATKAPAPTQPVVTKATASPATQPPVHSAKTASDGKSNQDVCYIWQYQGSDGQWNTYTTQIQQKIESTYLKNRPSVVIQINNNNERVIFKNNEMRNVDKQTSTKVRRIEADPDQLRELQEMYSSS